MISLTRLFNEELKKLKERIEYLENENKFLMSKLTKKEKKMQVNDYNRDYIDVTYQGNEYLLTQVDMTTYINSDFYGVVEIHSLVAHICPEYGDDIRVMVDDKFIEQLEKQLVEWIDWEEVSNQQYWNRIEALFPEDDIMDEDYDD